MTTATPAAKVLRVLHVGVGNRGHWPLDACKPQIGFTPGALCDVSQDHLAAARTKTGLGVESCFTDLGQALAQAKVDCAIVCTPTIFHVPMARQIMAAGLPVMVEKGMAPDWKSAQELVQVAAAGKGIGTVAQNYRYRGLERTIHRAIHDPTVPYHVGQVTFAIYSEPRVRPVPRTLTYPFACVWDMSCHHYDNMLSWFGAVEELTANAWRAEWSQYEHETNSTAHVTFKNGARVHYLHAHDAARISLHIEVHGKEGAIVLRDGQLTFNKNPKANFGTTPVQEVPQEITSTEGDMLVDFYNYITQGVEPGISLRNNLETMALCEMTVRSVQERRTYRRTELD